MYAFGILDMPSGAFSEEDISRLFSIAFKVEQIIHGKGRISEDAAPFSSGSSVYGSIVGRQKREFMNIG